MAGIKRVLGGAMFWAQDSWSQEDVKAVFNAAAAAGVKEIDSAQLYGDSEKILGDANASKDFEIATKLPGHSVPGSFRKDEVVKRTRESLEKLKQKQVDILYLHMPDASIPIEETLSGVQELYTAGAFRRFGISNYSTEEVQKIYDHQKSKGWVLPTVYQGNYSPVARNYEKELKPLLTKLGIAFYAYSPSAGGFLAKTREQIAQGSGRFSQDDTPINNIYRTLYVKDLMLNALDTWNQIAKDANIPPVHMAFRWVTYHSALKPEDGDAIIVGPRTTDQLRDTFKGLEEGPLSPEIVKRIDEVWKIVEEVAPSSNIEAFKA